LELLHFSTASVENFVDKSRRQAVNASPGLLLDILPVSRQVADPSKINNLAMTAESSMTRCNRADGFYDKSKSWG
jgi:hypothetical protein